MFSIRHAQGCRAKEVGGGGGKYLGSIVHSS